MQDFTHEELTITVKSEGNTVIMSWLGQSSAKDPKAVLQPYLIGLIEELTGRKLLMRYNQLTYMTSQSMLVILQFLAQLNTMNIRTVVTYDAKAAWQHVSFRTLETFCHKMEHISIRGE
jgi:hypothetical protein